MQCVMSLLIKVPVVFETSCTTAREVQQDINNQVQNI